MSVHTVTPVYDHDCITLRFDCTAELDAPCHRPCGCAGIEHDAECYGVAITTGKFCGWLEWDCLDECGPDRPRFDLAPNTPIAFTWGPSDGPEWDVIA